jgi:hypothetical protein
MLNFRFSLLPGAIAVSLFILSVSSAAAQSGGATCSQAASLACGQLVNGSTSGVTPDGLSTGNFEGTGGQHWFQFASPGNGTLTMNLCGGGTTYDSRIHVYSGSCDALSFVAQNDDQCGLASNLTWNATSGITYFVRIGGFSGSSGTYAGQFSCNLLISGCTNPAACNYNPQATQDNGSCDLVSCYGCTYPQATNYSPSATVDDGSCLFNVVAAGCTDPDACNYCSLCTVSDSSCAYDCLGCTYSEANNYNPAATRDDGSCDFTDTCPADLNDDNLVGVADLLVFIATFGSICE